MEFMLRASTRVFSRIPQTKQSPVGALNFGHRGRDCNTVQRGLARELQLGKVAGLIGGVDARNF